MRPMYVWIRTLLCLIYVWLKLRWIYVRPYLCETWLIAMHVWKFLEHIIYCYVSYLLNITSNMYCYVYYILQICPTVMCEFICLILLQIYNNQTKLYNFFTPGAKRSFYSWLNIVKWQKRTEGHRRNESSFWNRTRK